MKLVTFNIRYDNPYDGENSFANRRDFIREVVMERKPDVICFQEVLPHVELWLRENLDGYFVVGCGRDADLGGERVPVAFRTDRYDLINMESYWISPTPYVPGSAYPDQSDCPRIACEVVLRERETGELYRVTSIHLDHLGQVARWKGFTQVLSTPEKALAFPDAHIVVAGDFNIEPFYDQMLVLNDFPEYRDAAAESGGTWHNYGKNGEAKKIDYIYIRDDLDSKNVRVWDDCRDGLYLSDHYPVEVELTPAAGH